MKTMLDYISFLQQQLPAQYHPMYTPHVPAHNFAPTQTPHVFSPAHNLSPTQTGSTTANNSALITPRQAQHTTPMNTSTPVRPHPNRGPQVSPQPLPLSKKALKKGLSSKEIDQKDLVPIETVLIRIDGLLEDSKANGLALQLARECFFGTVVMKKCTPKGGGELPALPQTELYQLKKVVFKQYPAYWKNPAGFESIWERCMNAIEQACKRLR